MSQTKKFSVELTKDELTILQYVMPDPRFGDPLKDIYELREDEPEDPYVVLKTLTKKVYQLNWETGEES